MQESPVSNLGEPGVDGVGGSRGIHASLAYRLSVGVKRGEMDLTLHKKFLTADSRATKLVRGDNIERYSTRPRKDERKLSRARASAFLSETKKGLSSLIHARRELRDRKVPIASPGG